MRVPMSQAPGGKGGEGGGGLYMQNKRMYAPGFQLNPLGLPSFRGTLLTGISSRLCSIPASLYS